MDVHGGSCSLWGKYSTHGRRRSESGSTVVTRSCSKLVLLRCGLGKSGSCGIERQSRVYSCNNTMSGSD
jgi:hypothetical protein